MSHEVAVALRRGIHVGSINVGGRNILPTPALAEIVRSAGSERED